MRRTLKTKRLAAVLVAAALGAGSIGACGGDDDSSGASDAEKTVKDDANKAQDDVNKAQDTVGGY